MFSSTMSALVAILCLSLVSQAAARKPSISVNTGGQPVDTIPGRTSTINNLDDQSSFPGHIFFAADRFAKLFINERQVSEVTEHTEFQTNSLNLKQGDVVAFEVTDKGFWFGAVATLYYDAKLHLTGSAGSAWKAANKANIGNSDDWKTGLQTSCAWKPPSTLPGTGKWNPGKALNFPYFTRARYVWAQDATVKETIILRHVVGGEKCTGVINDVDPCSKDGRQAEMTELTQTFRSTVQSNPKLIPKFVRASFLDCFTASSDKPKSGCNGSLRLSQERKNARSRGLKKAIRSVKTVVDEKCMSFADG